MSKLDKYFDHLEDEGLEALRETTDVLEEIINDVLPGIHIFGAATILPFMQCEQPHLIVGIPELWEEDGLMVPVVRNLLVKIVHDASGQPCFEPQVSNREITQYPVSDGVIEYLERNAQLAQTYEPGTILSLN